MSLVDGEPAVRDKVLRWCGSFAPCRSRGRHAELAPQNLGGRGVIFLRGVFFDSNMKGNCIATDASLDELG
jgi:hypothetical protein